MVGDAIHEILLIAIGIFLAGFGCGCLFMKLVMGGRR